MLLILESHPQPHAIGGSLRAKFLPTLVVSHCASSPFLRQHADATVFATVQEALRGVDPQSPVARQHLPTLVPQIANNIRSAQAHLGHTAEGASLQALLAHLTALA